MKKYKILFSIPVHERFEIVLDQIANIFTLNEDCAIILHLSPVFDYKNSMVSLHSFKKHITEFYSGGVIINPESVRTGFFDIIQAHISNFRYACSVVDFDYIALLASNELFVKPKLYEHIKSYDVGINDGIIPITSTTKTGKSSHKDPDLRKMLQLLNTNDIYWSQIEGSYYKKDIFNNVCDVITRCFDYRQINTEDLYAREEVYFPTVFWGLYGQSNNINVDKKGMFTYVPWCRKSLTVSLKEAIRESENSSNIYCIKRVTRIITDPVRVYLRHKYGYNYNATDSNSIMFVLYIKDIWKEYMWRINNLIRRIKKKL